MNFKNVSIFQLKTHTYVWNKTVEQKYNGMLTVVTSCWLCIIYMFNFNVCLIVP